MQPVFRDVSTSCHAGQRLAGHSGVLEWVQRHAASFKEGAAHPLKAFQKMLGFMAAASPVLQLGLLRIRLIQFWLKQRVPSAAWHHGRHSIMVSWACVSALARWRDLLWLKQGEILDTAHRRKVVTTDASKKVGERCTKANRPSIFGPRRSRVSTSTA